MFAEDNYYLPLKKHFTPQMPPQHPPIICRQITHLTYPEPALAPHRRSGVPYHRMKTAIPTPDQNSLAAARARQNQLTKPPGSLGMLEDIACRFAAWQRREIPQALAPAINVFAADHGVCAEGVSAFPSAVTPEMVKNFVNGGAAINTLARCINASLAVVDVGVDADMSALPIVHAKVRRGSRNLLREAAMSAAETEAALSAGAQQARLAVEAGANLLIAGEMGIGNTTPSAALICQLAGFSPAAIVGRGTGIDDTRWQHKCQVVEQALLRVSGRQLTPLETLAELGGLEIAAMTGYYLEGARLGVPSLLDGFISSAAALVGCHIDPALKGWLLASHRSQETGHTMTLATLDLSPIIDCHLRLGEGSGAAASVPLLQMALALHAGMATFAQAGISDAL